MLASRTSFHSRRPTGSRQGSSGLWRTSNSGRTWQPVKAPTVPTPLPVVDLSATPKGWVPVAFGDAQISVPASWHVLYNSSVCLLGSPGGDVYVNPSGGSCSAKGTPKGETTVTLVSVNSNQYQPPTSYGQRSVINGIPVYALYLYGPAPHARDYLVPSLGVEIEVEGPLAGRVMNTLTRSPRTVALAPGSAPAIPSSWHSVTFAGQTFTAPQSWSVTRTSDNLGMGYPCTVPGVALVPKRGIVLSSDQQLAVYHCPSVSPLPLTPQNGIQVDAGSRTATQWTQQGVRLTFSTRCLSLHGLTACSATSPAYSILVLRVTLPGRSKPVYVSIGLAGNGMVARTILYSLRATPTTRSTSPPTGVVTGIAQACEGAMVLPGTVLHVKVTLQGPNAVASETVRSGARYRFAVPPGRYQLVGWWGSTDVTVRVGRVRHGELHEHLCLGGRQRTRTEPGPAS